MVVQSQEAIRPLAEQVTIRRTTYGVPHVLGENLRAVAFGLAYCELEDYGERVVKPLVAARGQAGLLDGPDAIEADIANRLGYERTVATYHLLGQDTRDLLEGFAAGVNHYLDRYPDSLAAFQHWRFTGYDVAAVTTSITVPPGGTRIMQRLQREKARRDSLAAVRGEGSNAWAFAPSRTTSGKAMLVRNPHLSWSAGYYEAHLSVPGKLNFYGDFRIGGLFAIIGGFNERLGWSTTNNAPDLEEVYALPRDPNHDNAYILDGATHRLTSRAVQVEYRKAGKLFTASREWWFSPYGPVIERDSQFIYILKAAGDGEYRRGEQFTRMLLARNLEEWKAAMRLQAITSSNYTYADADGHIFYVWNAVTPRFPIPSGGDSLAVQVTSEAQIWSTPVAFDSLPQLLDPPGGYLHNENDPFHFTNMQAILRPEQFPASFPAPRLRQRSQLSISLIQGNDQLSLEEVIARKHNMRMLVADQVKPDLLEIIRKNKPTAAQRALQKHLAAWDNTVRAESRGGVAFAEWWTTYERMMRGKELYRIPWDYADPLNTPSGIADPTVAMAALTASAEALKSRFGTWDLAWGDVHRLRRGEVDLPIGGGHGGLGCFRVLWFSDAPDGKRQISGGDGWQLAVEFTDPPRAYSVLAYGQTNNPASPHFTDQTVLFAESQMKAVAFTEDAIRASLLRAYSPGEE